MALCLVWIEGGPMVSPYRAPPTDPPPEGAALRVLEFGTRQEAMAHTRDLIGAPRVSGLAPHEPGGSVVLDTHAFAAE